MLLFQRLIASVQGIGCDIDVETAFSCDLCTFPRALSESNGYLREPDKPQLANAIWKCIGTCHITPPNCAHHVSNSKPTVVIGEDTDFLILLIHFVNKKKYRMFFSCETKILKVNPKYGVYASEAATRGVL